VTPQELSEIAAGRVRSYSVEQLEQILQRLDGGYRGITEGRHSGMSEAATLLAASCTLAVFRRAILTP